jgi:peptide/nickel transport system substrate-binding protein
MRKFPSIYLLILIAISGCQILNPVPPAPTLIPATPTPLPPVEMNICLGYEPESLYIYNAVSKAARSVLTALYDGPVDIIDGQPQPVILEDIPSINARSVRVTPIGVNPGDVVVNTRGNLVALQPGVSVFPTGCTSPSCAIIFDGISPLQMDQITADFKIRSDISWSDGQPLLASDSIFSFEIASDPATPINKNFIDQTSKYVALDDLTIEWTSQPGLVTNGLWNYFWSPLPGHAWKELSPSQLLESETANRAPLGWGAFTVNEWVPGDHIQLVKNPYYFRSSEGLPKIDVLNFIFTNRQELENIGQLANGRCDIVSDTVLDVKTLGASNPEDFGFKLITDESTRLEIVALGITPSSYDDNYYPYGVDRPDIFGDVRTRQAIAYCIDRDTIVNKLMRGSAEISNSMLPSGHPYLAGAAIKQYPYDPIAGSALLEAAGWLDLDQNPDTPLAHIGNAQIPFGTPLSLSLLVSESGLQNEIAVEISSSLAGCGIETIVENIAAGELYLPGPEGRIFGRKFDLALLSWDTGNDFVCEMFKSTEIPSDANDWLGETTGGANFFGYSNAQVDSGCDILRSAGSDDGLTADSAKILLETISDELPFIPLFHYLDRTLISGNVCFPVTLNIGKDLYTALETINLSGECE